MWSVRVKLGLDDPSRKQSHEYLSCSAGPGCTECNGISGESGTVRRILQPVRDANEGTLYSELGHTVYGLRQCALGSVGPMRYRMTEARMIGLGVMLRATGVLLRAAPITM